MKAIEHGLRRTLRDLLRRSRTSDDTGVLCDLAIETAAINQRMRHTPAPTAIWRAISLLQPTHRGIPDAPHLDPSRSVLDHTAAEAELVFAPARPARRHLRSGPEHTTQGNLALDVGQVWADWLDPGPCYALLLARTRAVGALTTAQCAAAAAYLMAIGSGQPTDSILRTPVRHEDAWTGLLGLVALAHHALEGADDLWGPHRG